MAGEAVHVLDLLAATHKHYIKKVADNISDESVLLNQLIKKGRLRDNKGGQSIRLDVKSSESSGVSGWNAYDLITFEAENLHSQPDWDWRGLKHSYIVAKMDVMKNKGDGQIYDYHKRKMDDMVTDFKQGYNAELYSTSTNNSIDGLAAFNTNSATYAGIAQGTYSWWNVQRTNGDGGANSTFATDYKERLTTALVACMRGENGKKNQVDIGITDATAWALVDSGLTANQRYGETSMVEAGFQNFSWNGVPMYFDRDVTAGDWHLLNLDKMELWTGHKGLYDTESETKLSPVSMVGVILTMHQLVVKSLRNQGLIFNCD